MGEIAEGMKAPEHVLRDLMRKCGDDVSETVLRSATLVSDAGDMAVITMGGASAALGLAIGFFMAGCDTVEIDEAVNALWERLRPSVLVAARDVRG